ncbi:MAG: hypothetical protein IKB75_01660 [Clostridia bacterium]|nr:hypothetical protein [Clostridia bacterium]
MNAYYDKNNQFISNNRIYEAYFTESKKKEPAVISALRKILSFVYTLLLQLGSARILKVCMIPLLVVGFLGVACAVESGAIGFGVGLLLLGILLFAEYLLLRGKQATKKRFE